MVYMLTLGGILMVNINVTIYIAAPWIPMGMIGSVAIGS